MNYLKKYNEILKERPNLKEINWQRRAIIDETLNNHPLTVIGAGTSSGKSLYEVIRQEIFYSLDENKDEITIVLTSGQRNLRDNFADNYEFFKPVNFVPKVVSSAKEAEQAIKDGFKVLVGLPQTFSRVKNLPKIHTLTFDEAHNRYLKKQVQDLIKVLKPKKQVLLTGTPFVFRDMPEYYRFLVPVRELYQEGYITNVGIEVVTSSYNFSSEDYNENDEIMTSAWDNSLSKTNQSLKKVCLDMIKKLKNPIKGLRNVNRLTKDTAGLLFKHLDKTVIWCGTIHQANTFAKTLRTFNGLKDAVSVSHSHSDADSSEMANFKKDKTKRILIMVGRAREGWSYRELFNCIDFTMSRNPSLILQMVARLFRQSEVHPDKKKIYYKVSNSTDTAYTLYLMKCVLLLFDEEWYSKFNGKNMGEMRVPRHTQPREREGERNTRKRVKREITPIEDFGIPHDLEFFNKNVFHKLEDKFATSAWTTMEILDKELNGFKRHSLRYAKYLASKYKSKEQFSKEQPAITIWIYNSGLQDEVYKDMFDWQCVHNGDNPEFIKAWLSKNKRETENEIKKIDNPIGGRRFSGAWYVQRAKDLNIDLTKYVFKSKRAIDSYTKEEVIKTAEKYKYATKFRIENNGMYWFARNNGFLEELEQSFKPFTIEGRYTKKEVMDTVKKGNFTSLSAIGKKHGAGMLLYIRKTGITDEVNKYLDRSNIYKLRSKNAKKKDPLTKEKVIQMIKEGSFESYGDMNRKTGSTVLYGKIKKYKIEKEVERYFDRSKRYDYLKNN